MKTKFKFLALAALAATLTIQTPFAHAGFFDDIKNAVMDGLDTPKQNLKAYASAQDKALVDAFYYISADGSEQSVAKDIAEVRKYKFVKLTDSSLTFSDFFKQKTMFTIVSDMRTYSFSPLDVFGKKYVSFANSRGNLIKQYKPALGGVFNSMLEQDFPLKPAPNVAMWTDVDNVLIEYTPNGEMVSLMTRSHQAVEQVTARSDQYIHFYFGKDLTRVLENRISNKMLDDNFQRVVTLSDQPPAVAVAASPGASAPQATSLATAATTGQPSFVVTPPPVINKPKSSPVEVAPTQESTVSPKQVQRIQMLQQLADLKKSGALTEEEFAKEKAKLLSN